MTTTIVGVDGSESAARALAWATEACGRSGDELLAVHVLTYDHELARDISLDTLRTWRIELRDDLEGPWTQAARDAGVRVRTKLVEDDSVAAGILAQADEPEVTTVVLGANGHGGLADRLLAATSYKVAHRAKVPVVIIPPGWTEVSAAA
jgi:nucleotide-binding universal stress UspA family protein